MMSPLHSIACLYKIKQYSRYITDALTIQNWKLAVIYEKVIYINDFKDNTFKYFYSWFECLLESVTKIIKTQR